MSAILAARRSCARGVSNSTVGIRCEPFGVVPPCISGGGKFFDVPLSEVMLEPPGVPRRAVLPLKHRRLAQCYARKRNEDWWMSHDPHALPISTRTRSAADVNRLLGDRVVTLVGASDVEHLLRAIECHLARHDLHEATACRWKRWGWASLERDNCACQSQPAATIACTANASAGYSLEAMLNATDVVLIAYNPQHYSRPDSAGRRHLAPW